MVQFNLALREINCKVVYFGPGLSGKTTNLEVVHQKAPEESRGVLSSIATESDRTLFFDFMPLSLGTVGGLKSKFQLYTVPGQVYYNSTRKLVLRGADGVVFIADSNPEKMSENLDSLQNLEDCLKEQGRALKDTPHVIQFNKRDLPNALTFAQMSEALNRYGAPCFEATASQGNGVIETFKGLSVLVLEKVKSMAAERVPERAQAGPPAGAGEPKVTNIQRNAPPMPQPAPVREQETAVAVKAPPVRSEPRPRPAAPAPQPVAQEESWKTKRSPSSSPHTQRVIVSSKHGRTGMSRALIATIVVAVVGIIGAIVFFVFVKR
jgi:signal recognition particle receptor subunit beta